MDHHVTCACDRGRGVPDRSTLLGDFALSGYEIVGSATTGRRFDLAPDGDRFIVRKRGTAEQTSDDDPFNGLIFVENWHQELLERVPVP